MRQRAEHRRIVEGKKAAIESTLLETWCTRSRARPAWRVFLGTTSTRSWNITFARWTVFSQSGPQTVLPRVLTPLSLPLKNQGDDMLHQKSIMDQTAKNVEMRHATGHGRFDSRGVGKRLAGLMSQVSLTFFFRVIDWTVVYGFHSSKDVDVKQRSGALSAGTLHAGLADTARRQLFGLLEPRLQMGCSVGCGLPRERHKRHGQSKPLNSQC